MRDDQHLGDHAFVKLSVTVGTLERFEDVAGIGVFSLVNGGEREWTIKRLRMLARVSSDESDAAIDAWLSRDLVGALAQSMDAVTAALTPPQEAVEHLPGGEGGESEGNSPPGAGSSSLG